MRKESSVSNSIRLMSIWIINLQLCYFKVARSLFIYKKALFALVLIIIFSRIIGIFHAIIAVFAIHTIRIALGTLIALNVLILGAHAGLSVLGF